MSKRLEELSERMTKIKEEAKVEMTSIFKEETDILFEKYDWLEEISWTQYTPYFNDGDSCEFSVNSDVSINGTEGYLDGRKFKIYDNTYSSIISDDTDEFIDTIRDNKQMQDEYIKVQDTMEYIVGFLANNEDIALDMFGDHTKVSVQRGGTYTEKYDHD